MANQKSVIEIECSGYEIADLCDKWRADYQLSFYLSVASLWSSGIEKREELLWLIRVNEVSRNL